jgi:hypothetical protein
MKQNIIYLNEHRKYIPPQHPLVYMTEWWLFWFRLNWKLYNDS